MRGSSIPGTSRRCLVGGWLLAAALPVLAVMAPSQLWGRPSSSAPAQEAPEAQKAGQQAALISSAERYLNDIRTLKARFVQVAPDGGISSGTLYLKRPGKMRWQYAPPVPVVMVSRGTVLRYYDYELKQASDIPLYGTLAGVLARDTIDFSDEDIRVLYARQYEATARIRITHREQPEEGELEFIFQKKPFELTNIVIKDAEGKETNISLKQAETNLDLEEGLFEFMGSTHERGYQR